MAVDLKYDKKTNKFTIIMDGFQEPRDSKSGKTVVLASTLGNVTTGTEYEGKPIVFGGNIYVKA